MKFRQYLFLAAIFSFITFSSCSKDEDEDPPTTTTYSNPTPTFSDMDGLLAAIQVISYQEVPVVGGEFAVYADVATAAFFNGTSTYDEAGIVSVNSFDLESFDNNSYVLPGQSSTSIDFDFDDSSPNSWSVGGGTNVPSFSYTTSKRMPGDVKFDGDYSSVNPANNLTVAIESSPVNADSILFVVAFENTTLTKIVSPNTTSATFTSTEMSGASGTGVVQVAAYNFEFSMQGTKKYYFINESVVSQVTSFD